MDGLTTPAPTPSNPESLCPTQIQIGALRLNIKFIEDPSVKINNAESEEIASDSKVFGTLSIAEQTIYLASGQGPDIIADTLLHEVLHGVWSVVGGWSFTEIEEEKLVSILTNCLLDTFRRNKELTRYLFL